MTAKICAVVVPPVFALGITVLVELTIGKIKGHDVLRSLGMLAAGLASAAAIYALNAYWSAKARLIPPPTGSLRSLFTGIAVGILISVCAAILFFLAQRPSLGEWSAFSKLPYTMTANVFPAATEELGFRGGTVHFLSQMSGPTSGLVGGSIPFGLAHLLGRLFGQPFVPAHILAASFAGLLFSAAFLRFGLAHAIGMHWSWNSLLRCWVVLFQLDSHRGVQAFEGAWTTALLTLMVAVFYILYPRLLISGR